jgi:hypothetical protein
VLQLPIAGQVKSSQGQAKGQAEQVVGRAKEPSTTLLLQDSLLLWLVAWTAGHGAEGEGEDEGRGTMGEVRNGET